MNFHRYDFHHRTPLRTLIFALSLLLLPIGCLAQLRSANSAHSLYGVPGNRIQLGFEAVSVDALGATLVIRVFPFDYTGKVAPSPIATYYRKIDATQQGRPVSVAVTMARPGFYRAEAELDSLTGTPLGYSSVTFALVQKRRSGGPSDFGIVTHFAQGQGAPSVVLPLVQQAGFSWIRDELYWQEIEKAPGHFSFPARYDAFLELTARLGISPLIVLDYGNRGAYPKIFGQSPFPQTPEARTLFVRYVSKVVKRYDKVVKHWELWNEPSFNEIGYSSYLSLLKESHSAIKKLSPDATLISCGGGGTGGGPGGDCVIQLIKDGGLDDQDGFSVHPYMSPNTPEKGYPAKGGPIDVVSIPTTWPYLQSLAVRHPKGNGQHLQVWVTEFGWPVNPKVQGQDETSQAANLVRSYLLSRRYNAIRVLFWYDLMDDGTDPNNYEHNFGLLHHDLSPKPAFVAASVLATTLGNRPWRNALVDTDDIKVYQYGNGDAVTAGWTIGATRRVASINLRPGQYIQRDWQGVETSVTVTTQPFDWELGPLPRYLLPVRAVN
ncbi:beta-glucosidase [Burkholderia ubonensis]|uniref:cellulase family glycosylhydrolase n=1 Tax=Burkholderia ubonensis TaxID=101571 RepID=UPI000759C5CC|nr:cellulase family glycosylhydrolase [Burkholderia ubonensis]KVU38850.1 beta-glucosidase [Burkholderia ubonensis]